MEKDRDNSVHCESSVERQQNVYQTNSNCGLYEGSKLTDVNMDDMPMDSHELVKPIPGLQSSGSGLYEKAFGFDELALSVAGEK